MKLPGGTASGSTPSPRSPRPSACTAPQCTATSTRRADIAAGPQDAPRHAGQAARRVLLRRNTAIDAEPAQLVAAAVQVALQSGAPQRRRRKAACSSRQPRAAVLRWQRLPGSFGARDTSVNGTSSVSSARLKVRRVELAVLAAVRTGISAGSLLEGAGENQPAGRPGFRGQSADADSPGGADCQAT